MNSTPTISTLTNSTLSGFSKPYFYVLIVQMSTLSIQFVLGFSLNCYIIFILLSRGGGVDVSAVFTLNHTAAEIIFSISAVLYVLISDIFNFIVLGTSMSARLLFLCCVCLERYLAVVHPVTFLRLKTLRYRVACSVLVWICSLVLGISMCTLKPSLFKILISVYVIILAVEFFCCVSILRRLRDPGPRDMGREQGEMNAAKKKAFQIVFINLLTCLAQNLPLAVLYILKNGQVYDDFSIAHVICVTINIFAEFVQPVMILYRDGKLSTCLCW